jgi:uncharacterized protein (DUF2252 family)
MATPETISERIKQFNSHLLQDKVQIKYKLMAAEPFRFYRGTCHIFYEDLGKADLLRNSPNVWLSGDLHLENFGSFKGDNRLVYFDLNDFDEAILGPVLWELARILTSIFVAFDSFGIEENKTLKWVEQFLSTYTKILSKGKSRYIELLTAKGIVRSFLDQVNKRKESVLIKKHIERKKASFRIDNKKHFKLVKEQRKELSEHIREWMQKNDTRPRKYDVLDVSFRIAGTGSLGVKRYVFLLRSVKDKSKYWLLDMKQAVPSSLAPYINVKQPDWEFEAARVAAAKLRMQNISPALLSTTIFQNDSYIIQEMQPMEDKINFWVIKDRFKEVAEVINNMALLTASAQLRSSGRQGSAIADELIEFGKNPEWQKGLLNYASNYSKQVKKDYQQYQQDYKNGFFNSPAQ